MSTHNPDTYGALLELLQQLTPEQLKMKVRVTIDPRDHDGVLTDLGKVPTVVGSLLTNGITVEL